MKISKIIDELTELKEYIGDKEVEACNANAAMTCVNVMYHNDDGGITSTCLKGEKMDSQLKATMSDQEALDKIKVKVLHLDFCEASNDPDLVARVDVEVTNDTSLCAINGIDLRYNDTTGNYSIVEPTTSSGVRLNELIRRAVTSAVVARYEQIKHSDEMLEKLATATSIDRKEYGEILSAISAHFDRDEMDVHDCLQECRLQLKAAYAYINYLENSKVKADKYMEWQANRIKELKEALRKERDRFQPNGLSKAFTEMFENSIKTALNDSLDKIETTCVTALNEFCQQMEPSAYDKQ